MIKKERQEFDAWAMNALPRSELEAHAIGVLALRMTLCEREMIWLHSALAQEPVEAAFEKLKAASCREMVKAIRWAGQRLDFKDRAIIDEMLGAFDILYENRNKILHAVYNSDLHCFNLSETLRRSKVPIGMRIAADLTTIRRTADQIDKLAQAFWICFNAIEDNLPLHELSLPVPKSVTEISSEQDH